ncbi:MAG: hypothetical protein ABFD61_00945 [Chloroherpetonaceae bacterium]
MKNPLMYFLVIILSIGIASNAFSQKQKSKSNDEFKKFEVEINYMNRTASSYYNLNDSNISYHNIYDPVNDTTRRYTFDFYQTILGLKFRYNYNPKLAFSIYSPFSFYSMDEKFFTDQYGYREKKASHSLNRVDYIALDAYYKLYEKSIYVNFQGEIRIPTGFHNGLYNDPKFNFLSDGAFEFLMGANFGIKYHTIGWENTVIYNYRAEDFKDQMIINTAIVLSTVPNSELRLFGNFIVSTSKFDNTRQLNIMETVNQENNYGVGAAFFMMFSESFNVGVNYQVTLGGKNTWKSSYFNIKAGIRL